MSHVNMPDIKNASGKCHAAKITVEQWENLKKVNRYKCQMVQCFNAKMPDVRNAIGESASGKNAIGENVK